MDVEFQEDKDSQHHDDVFGSYSPKSSRNSRSKGKKNAKPNKEKDDKRNKEKDDKRNKEKDDKRNSRFFRKPKFNKNLRGSKTVDIKSSVTDVTKDSDTTNVKDDLVQSSIAKSGRKLQNNGSLKENEIDMQDIENDTVMEELIISDISLKDLESKKSPKKILNAESATLSIQIPESAYEPFVDSKSKRKKTKRKLLNTDREYHESQNIEPYIDHPFWKSRVNSVLKMVRSFIMSSILKAQAREEAEFKGEYNPYDHGGDSIYDIDRIYDNFEEEECILVIAKLDFDTYRIEVLDCFHTIIEASLGSMNDALTTVQSWEREYYDVIFEWEKGPKIKSSNQSLKKNIYSSDRGLISPRRHDGGKELYRDIMIKNQEDGRLNVSGTSSDTDEELDAKRNEFYKSDSNLKLDLSELSEDIRKSPPSIYDSQKNFIEFSSETDSYEIIIHE